MNRFQSQTQNSSSNNNCHSQQNYPFYNYNETSSCSVSSPYGNNHNDNNNRILHDYDENSAGGILTTEDDEINSEIKIHPLFKSLIGSDFYFDSNNNEIRSFQFPKSLWNQTIWFWVDKIEVHLSSNHKAAVKTYLSSNGCK